VGPSCRREKGERERVGLVRGELGRLFSQVRSKWLLASFFYFFPSAFFFFCSDFCFEFLKKLFYSDLDKIKADPFWSLKSVFRTYKPEV
jgi:hypothetical protein